jgi:salicylate hydroxylase
MPLVDAERRWGAPYLVAHRADLQRVLVAAVADEPSIALHLGTALAGFGTTASGVAVTLAQGRLKRGLEGDALIGADGVRSVVRAKLTAGDADPPLETGRTAWRALIEADALDPTFAAPETGLWLGGDAHLVHYRIQEGQLLNVVAITRDAMPADPENLWAKPGDAAGTRAPAR